MTDERYTAKGQTVDEIMQAVESGELASTYAGSTSIYLQAALTAAAVRSQEQWAKIASLAAVASLFVAVAAVVVAALR
jgi:hypothetical protein